MGAAYEERINPITLRTPSTAFSASQYYVVMASSSEGYFRLPTTNSTGAKRAIAGVLQDAPTISGEACQIATYGSITKVIVGSSQLKAGDSYRVTSAGIVRLASSGASQREILYGPYLSAAQSTGSYGVAMINVVGITT